MRSNEISLRLHRSLTALTRIPLRGDQSTREYLRTLPRYSLAYALPCEPSNIIFHDRGVLVLNELVVGAKPSAQFEKLFDGLANSPCCLMIVDDQLPMPESIYLVWKREVNAGNALPVGLDMMVRPKMIVAPSREKGYAFFAFPFAAFFK